MFRPWVVPRAPDGGWGWLCCVGSGITLFLAGGLPLTFSLIFQQIIDRFGGSAAQASGIYVITAACAMLTAPFVSALVQKFTCRAMGMIGGALVTIGAALAAVANSIPALYLTYGVMTGLGLCCVTISCFITMNSFFHKRKARAVAISGSMDGIGGLVLPPLLTAVFSSYGFPGVMFTIAAVSAHLVIAGALFRPIKVVPPKVAPKVNGVTMVNGGDAKANGVATGCHPRLPVGYVHYARGRLTSGCSLDDVATTSSLDLTKDESTTTEDPDMLATDIVKPKSQEGAGNQYKRIENYTPISSHKSNPQCRCIEEYDAMTSETKENENCLMNGKAPEHTPNERSRIPRETGVLATGRRVFKSYFDVNTICKPKFLASAGVVGGMSVAMGTANLFLASFGKERGFTTAQVAMLLSVRSGMFLLYKPMSGIAFDHDRLRLYRLEMFAGLGLFGGLCTALAPFATNNLSVVLVWVVNSFFVSWIVAQEYVVIAETVSLPKFPSALGLARFIRGVFSLSGNLIAGVIVDAWTYNHAYYYAGTVLMAMSSIMIGVCCMERRKERKLRLMGSIPSIFKSEHDLCA